VSAIDPSSTTNESRPKIPWVTLVAALACFAVYFGLMSEKELSWATMAKWGVAPGATIWNGFYWPLLTSVFVHVDLWHVAANVYWLWVFGSLIERRLGAIRYALFFTVSAFVSSSFQLAASDDTGYGASGVVFAMYGLLLPLRSHWPEARAALPMSWIGFLNMWLVGCVLVDYLGVFEVGNTAHFSGLAFGLLAAGLVASRRKRLCTTGVVGMTAAAGLFLAWAPWSVVWLANEAYKRHAARDFREAIRLYSRVIEKSPNDAWAYENRGNAYLALGLDREADADLAAARRLTSAP
jgi:rhomboid protease GluP